jgi:16S rRNA (cytosine967-C5)-methyltransferase
VLDLCASPGGKTTAIAESMGDTGALIACDVRSRRVDLLQRTVGTWRTRHTHVVHVASSGALPFRCAFDRVIVDAPCSGLGTIRRDPDIRWRRHEDELPLFAALQRVLLERAAAAVASGGRLVYATCSSEAEENEEVVAAFASDHSEFERVDLREEAILAPVVDGSGALRTWPFAHSLEAFFAAALVRR